jgi:trk system potassium uptake protein TrkA
MALVEHEVPEHDLIHLLELRKENLEIVEVQIDTRSPCLGKALSSVSLPDGAQLIAVVRDGEARLGDGELKLESGDQVLGLLQPGREEELREALLGR